ncbi:MAG: DUF3793 family protein [Tissierellia bacterium]|nr:DUF3793 family protein [Tissierellia bacterium]
MRRRILFNFYQHIETFDDLEHLLAILKMVTAPTKNQLKLGTMVNLRNGLRPHRDTWFTYKNIISGIIGLSYEELKITKDNVLILFYRRKRMIKKMKEKKIRDFLASCGYEKCQCLEDHFEILKFRFQKSCPDEIGVFLGYPLKDVIDFKKKTDTPCKCVGYWKCFNNVDSSKKAFERYDNVKFMEIKKIVGQ